MSHAARSATSRIVSSLANASGPMIVALALRIERDQLEPGLEIASHVLHTDANPPHATIFSTFSGR